MKTKAIAVLAVLAMAFAVVAVYDDADATPAVGQSKYVATVGTPLVITVTDSETTYEGYTFESSVPAVIASVTTASADALSSIAVLAPGYTQLTITCVTADTGDTDPTVVANVYAYTPYGDHPYVIGYAKDATTGLQGIVYSDGTALLDFPTSVAVNHVSVAVYNGTSYDAFAGMIGFEQRMNLDFRGVLDVTAITDNDDSTLFQIGLTSAFATANNDLGVLNFQPYTVTLDVNTANHGISFRNLEETAGPAVTSAVIGTVASTSPVAPAISMIKGAALEEIIYRAADTSVDPAVAELNLFQAITPTGEESVTFIGFANVATATEAELAITAATVIEDFIFGLEPNGVTSDNTVFAIYQQNIYQIYISDAGFNGNLHQATQTVATNYAVTAPSVAVSGDVVLVKIVNSTTSVARYAVSVYSYAAATADPAPTTLNPLDIQPRMLTNSIFAFTVPEQDIIIVVTPTTGTSTTGYQFGMQSVTNDAGVGTAVAQLTLFDYVPADDANLAITMDGTFFRTLGNTHIFGSIANLTAQGALVYNAVIDGVAQQTTDATPAPIAYGEAGVGVTAGHNNYVVSLVNPTGGDVGFYAVKAIFGDDDTQYMLM